MMVARATDSRKTQFIMSHQADHGGLETDHRLDDAGALVEKQRANANGPNGEGNE